MREHTCPACGFEMDRDANATLRVFSREFENPELGQPGGPAPVETAFSLFISSSASDVVDRKRVIGLTSLTLKEPALADE